MEGGVITVAETIFFCFGSLESSVGSSKSTSIWIRCNRVVFPKSFGQAGHDTVVGTTHESLQTSNVVLKNVLWYIYIYIYLSIVPRTSVTTLRVLRDGVSTTRSVGYWDGNVSANKGSEHELLIPMECTMVVLPVKCCFFPLEMQLVQSVPLAVLVLVAQGAVRRYWLEEEIYSDL